MTISPPNGERGTGVALLDLMRGQPRTEVGHRFNGGLLLESKLVRSQRPKPVPFILGYSPADGSGLTLEHVHAGASAVTVIGDSTYLFLSDVRGEQQRENGYRGRSLRRHQPDQRREPELLLGTARDVVSFAAASSNAVAAVWMDPLATSLADDAARREARPAVPPTAAVVGGDLWPRSSYNADGDVLRLVHVPLDAGTPAPELLDMPLEPDIQLTGRLALTPDGRRCAAGLVRFLRGGHRRYGMLLFAFTEASKATAVWMDDDDLRDAVAAPDGSWFACTAERVATPGHAPRQTVILIEPIGARLHRTAARHDNWLQARAWAAPDLLLCVGEERGQRHLWQVSPEGGQAQKIDLPGSVQTVTTTADEAIVVRSGIDMPPEVVSLSVDEIRTAHGSSARQRRSPRVLLAPSAAVAPSGRMERIRYRSPDGSTWFSWLCLPAGETTAPLPVLVWCHGGPLLSWTDWSWRWNPWPFVAEGFAVLMPDPPLSVGYGQEAVQRGWGRWTSDVAAVAAAQVRAALLHPSLDRHRVAAMGGSFGGYLALALATLLPEVRLIASHAGWADFAAVARAADLHWHWLREYGPIGESTSYRRESLNLNAISTDVRILLSHGCDDAHVPVGEARGMYRSLDTRGCDVHLMLFPDESHTIERPANVDAWYSWVLQACHETLAARSQTAMPA